MWGSIRGELSAKSDIGFALDGGELSAKSDVGFASDGGALQNKILAK
jgi:hypothetical protein